jgi:hypothetical protein
MDNFCADYSHYYMAASLNENNNESILKKLRLWNTMAFKTLSIISLSIILELELKTSKYPKIRRAFPFQRFR